MSTQAAYLRGKSRKSGTTLVEVMLGAFILAVMAIAVVTALYYPRWLVVSCAHKQAAIHAATDALEQAFVAGYNSLTNGTVSLDSIGSLGSVGSRFNMNGRWGNGTRTVQTLGSPPYKLITVTVNYPNGDKPVVLETRITPAH